MIAEEKETETMFSTVNQLLSPKPMLLETGVKRLDNGMLLVSVRTDLHGCKSRMLDWWFKYFETTEHLKWWHPHDHVSHGGWDSFWIKNKNYIGATIRATESLGDIPPLPAVIKFHDPAEVFNPVLLDQAYDNEDVGAVVYARIGFGEHAPVDHNGDPMDGYMFHVARDTPFGCVLRSQFYLGATVADTPNPLPEEIGLGLMQHCYSEFTYLSRFLASIYYAENQDGDKAPLPW
ncbi:hypothetical protein OZ668_08735 [Elizabethkingia sp. HX XZB]|uniref:DAPG hydrolase family protein n=1 Tax=Elizabethkingia sp. HX XZB TaxID=3003193 RepID=UPI002A248BA9|nr:hypothetical protein [Elizabethkingia sp. HX XZB]MDX8568068.1 hypothetical protein [Elizabethkingia sp. HX XZB]